MTGRLLYVARRALALAIVCLIVVGPILLSGQSRTVFASPSYWLLAMFSCMLVIPRRDNGFATLQKILAVYLLAMGVDYTSGVYWPLPLWGSLQVAAGLCVVAAVGLAVWLVPRRGADNVSVKEPAVALVAAGGVVALFLLAVGLLLERVYGFGAERSFAVGGQLAMTLLTGVVAWHLAGDTAIRIAVGTAGIAAYSWMAIFS